MGVTWFRFVFQEGRAGCREGHILELDKTKDKEPIWRLMQIQAREDGSLGEYVGKGNGKKWSESGAPG